MFAAMKLFMAAETQKKLTALTYGAQLANELGPNIPEAYGGKAGELATIGQTPKTDST